MKLVCKSCRLPIQPQDINLEMALAKCQACGEVFSFLDEMGGEIAAPKVVLPVPKPKRFVVEELGSELTIGYRWFTPALFFLLLFCLFWDGFMTVWYGIAIREIMGGEVAGWIMGAFGLLHLAVGVAITYATLVSFVNSTTIQVAGGQLTVRHGPICWGGNQTLDVSQIQQLYCTEQRHSGKGSSTFRYELCALTKDDTKVTLVSGLRELEEALFLEQRLEEKLGIVPQRVPGEIAS